MKLRARGVRASLEGRRASVESAERRSRPKMSTPSVDVVFFHGCPNVHRARENLRIALGQLGRAAVWSEWDVMSGSTPERFRRYGSPTVLVDGRDVTGDDLGAAAPACRADGAPSAEMILRSLEAAR
jgi:hypothetical protein